MALAGRIRSLVACINKCGWAISKDVDGSIVSKPLIWPLMVTQEPLVGALLDGVIGAHGWTTPTPGGGGADVGWAPVCLPYEVEFERVKQKYKQRLMGCNLFQGFFFKC